MAFQTLHHYENPGITAGAILLPHDSIFFGNYDEEPKRIQRIGAEALHLNLQRKTDPGVMKW